MDVNVLWYEYQQTHSQELKEKLVIFYQKHVLNIVARLAYKSSPVLDRDDLYGYGMLGLLEAIGKFDPQRNIKFETFAYPRIKGAIIDAIRKLSGISRTQIANIKNLNEVQKVAAGEGKELSDSEIAETMEIDLADVHKIYEQIHLLTHVSIEGFFSAENAEGFLINILEDKNSPNPYLIIEQKDLHNRLLNALEKLSERDRILLALYYKEEMTLKEIGAVLEISESRACQIHGKIISKLKAVLASEDN